VFVGGNPPSVGFPQGGGVLTKHGVNFGEGGGGGGCPCDHLGLQLLRHKNFFCLAPAASGNLIPFVHSPTSNNNPIQQYE